MQHQLLTEFFPPVVSARQESTALTAPESVHMLAFEGMMNAQRNRGMYLRVARGSPKFANPARYRRLNSLLGVVEGTIQNYEHGRNEPNITRLYDTKRGRQPRVEYICRRVTAQNVSDFERPRCVAKPSVRPNGTAR